MRDYTKLVSRTPPEGLERFAAGQMDTFGLVYRTEWVWDDSPDAILTGKDRKVKMVRCRCSGCGRSGLMDYAMPGYSYRGGKPVYGFYHPDSGETVTDGDSTLCPMCGTPVTVRLASRVGRGEFTAAEAYVLSASALEGETGQKPFVLTGWRVRRMVDREARERYQADPWEAYIFDPEGGACQLKGWVKGYSGSCGYLAQVCSQWRQKEQWSESWGRVGGEIFGLTPELLEDSCMHNSKFDLYMAGASHRAKAPVPYLRAYQERPQVENLVTAGFGYILDGLFEERMGRSAWKKNVKGYCPMPEIDWTQRTPAKLLRLNREELRHMKEMGWDLYHWEVYVKDKVLGGRMELPGDMELLHQYGGEDVERVLGKAPVGKSIRYLMKQIERVCFMNDPYNEYYDVYVDGETICADMLADYWEMAEEVGMDLGDPAVKWPKDLFAAHDAVSAAALEVRDKKLAARFGPRKKELERYAYASGGLMIVPAGRLESFVKEGEALNHCVARYANDHARGETAIFFIRHSWAPKTSYFTLEYDEEKEKVRQNRGKNNRARTPEVEAFEAEWLEWIHGGCPRHEDGTPVGAKPVVKEKPKKECDAA